MRAEAVAAGRVLTCSQGSVSSIRSVRRDYANPRFVEEETENRQTQDKTPAPRSFQLCLLPLPQAQGAIDPIWLPYQRETVVLFCRPELPGSVKRSLMSLSTLEKCV
ncbi:hypothetical protein MG293_013777 [Ovis ammon polii]|uniref:Uncharacterized protein n=1 Tax=Ovis ammon polii TaxID=230172 RepID=A0AAD4U2B8_OVIAM|nr:hypothetical protein MG293_013777 [Ovis ammon polii]